MKKAGRGERSSLGKREFRATSFHKKTKERRPLAVGVTYHDRILGDGVVKSLTDEEIVVLFGEKEKVFSRRKKIKSQPIGKLRHETQHDAELKKPKGSVFVFKDAREKLLGETPKRAKREVKIGIHVTDHLLGPGVVSKITERGTYVTYDRTGEHVLYPYGLTVELLKSAFPEEKRKKPTPTLLKEKARVYKVPEKIQQKTLKDDIEMNIELHGGRVPEVKYIEVAEGTRVVHAVYGVGIIREVTEHTFVVDFDGKEKEFPYPASIACGDLVII